MTRAKQFHSPAEAARMLGVSSKALRLYEQRGFIKPIRDAAGWRHYGAVQMQRAREVVALRTLGLSLRQIETVLTGSGAALQDALARHEAQLQGDIARLARGVEQVRSWQGALRAGLVPDLSGGESRAPALSMRLPWPWAGETFELARLAPVTYLVGSLGSGKTRLAIAMAEALGGRFVDLDRKADGAPAAAAQDVLDWLHDDGAVPSPALEALANALCAERDGPVVIDLIEYQLDGATQLALGAWLRLRWEGDTPLVVMTRSSAILDMEAVSPGHAIVYCPANHMPPFEVLAVRGTPGHESVSNCLGTPEARARLALRPA